MTLNSSSVEEMSLLGHSCTTVMAKVKPIQPVTSARDKELEAIEHELKTRVVIPGHNAY